MHVLGTSFPETYLIKWFNFTHLYKTVYFILFYFRDPNSVTVPKWEKYKLDDFTYVNFDYNITEHQRIYADRVKFWLEDLPNITTSSLFGLH